MPTEAEKRLHRCCFSGHRPEKLDIPEDEIKAWLHAQIRQAVSDGYMTFICGMGMGVDIMAGQIVRTLREKDPSIRLICVVPWPGFAARWKMIWKGQYDFLLEQADYVKYISRTYHDGVFRMRNEYMVDHSNRLIAYYNGTPGGTWDTIEYAVRKKTEIVTNRPELVQEYRDAIAGTGGEEERRI